ncbi:methionine adenosyltransferase [Candidatus Woesearchaeota archaeon]|nr:methionine adenosyltransferase [Candidatus Woesearchaeota archaeon]
MKKNRNYVFSSESVTDGHPDKVCDQISDSILDAALSQDRFSRVACETMVKTNFVALAGEITTKTKINYRAIVSETLKRIGYTQKGIGFDIDSIELIDRISEQSPDISQGVTEGNEREQGAGDQGMMMGYASNETIELMPLPIMLAHGLTRKLREVRVNGIVDYLRPDGKSQVAVNYVNGKPVSLKNIVLAAHHSEMISLKKLREELLEIVIKPICHNYMTKSTEVFINATGKFEIGGPAADAGVTGRKIIVDTYGSKGRHGGGAFSGKDPSKVDRSGAYAARYIAKNIVASGLADRVEVQLAYCIGVAKPTSICIDTFGTSKLDEALLEKAVMKIFPVKPKEIIGKLGLLDFHNYKDTAAFGHFGREEFPWEKIDKVENLLNYFH